MQSKSLSSVTTEEQICQIWKVASTGQFSRPDPERQTHLGAHEMDKVTCNIFYCVKLQH